MDRSSLRQVSTTNDAEKRLVFKEKLAQRLDATLACSLETDPVAVPNRSFALLPIGTIVWHPDLGACTISSIDEKKNSIVLDFPDRGLIDLVLSQVHSKLVPDKDGVPALVDKASLTLNPSLVETLTTASPTNWTRISPDIVAATEKSLATKPQIKADPVPARIPVGTTVWHPDLGACTVSSVDEKKNSIVLDFPDRGKIDMVLSQVSLRLISDRNGSPDLGREAPSTLEPSMVEKLETVSPTEWRRIAPEAVAAAERRLATRPKLSSEPTEIANGMPVGTLVWHPGLGPCTIFSIDRKKNSIILESGLGKIDLVLSQVESKLVPDNNGAPAYADKSAPAFVEPSLIDSAEAFSHTNWHRAEQPTIYTEKKAPAAKERVKKVSGHLPLGSSVWHPDFGACTVSSINVKTNTIVLDFATFGSLDMVLSQAEPKLLPLDGRNYPTHAGKRQSPKIQPPASTIEPVAQSSISLPEVFKTWKPGEQFSYLTKEKHLTTEAANEFIAGLSGRFNTTHSFEVTWDEVLDKGKKLAFKDSLLHKVSQDPVAKPVKASQHTEVQPLAEVTSLSVTLPKIFTSLQPSGQYSFLTQTKHLTPNEANDVIAVHLGNEPRSQVIPEILWDDGIGLTESGVQRTFKAPEPKIDVPVVRKCIDLPPAFKTWKPVEQYQYLTASKHLTSVDANNVIEAVRYRFACDFDIVWNELPETEKRLAYKQSLLSKIEAASIVVPQQPPTTPLSDALTHVGVERIMAQTEVVKKIAVPRGQRLSVVAPVEFKTWNASDQYTFFTKTKKLTPNEANDLISVYNGKQPQDLRTQYEFVWSTLDAGLDSTQVRRSTDSVEREEREIVSKLQSLSVTLPQVFRTWRTAEQFSFLTHAKRLSAEEANNILAVHGGKTPDDTSIRFDIVWDDK